MDYFADNINEISDWAQRHCYDFNDLVTRDQMTADWIQDSGYTPDMPNALQRFLARVRFWLRQHGFYNANISDRDLVYMLSEITRAGYEKRWNEKEWAQRESNGDVRNGTDEYGERFSVNENGEPLFNVDGLGLLTLKQIDKRANEHTKILTDSGDENWGYITAEMVESAKGILQLEELPIRLFVGNIHYGINHISKHFKEIRIKDISYLIEEIFSKPNTIYGRMDGNKIKLEAFPNPPAHWGILELRKEIDCYSIVSVYPRDNKHSKPQGKKIWEYSTRPVSLQAANSMPWPITSGLMPQEAQEELASKSALNINPLGVNVKRQSSKNNKKGRKVRHSVAPQIDSEQFKKFFENSVVVDESGEPMVVYHGSSADFTVFDHKFAMRNGAAKGRGFYFTSDRESAEGYKTADGKLFEVYLSMQKPLNPDELTITKAEVEKIIRAAIKTKRAISQNGLIKHISRDGLPKIPSLPILGPQADFLLFRLIIISPQFLKMQIKNCRIIRAEKCVNVCIRFCVIFILKHGI